MLCGYSHETRCFVAKDPAAEAETVLLPAAALDSARKAFGTDEDLLLVAVPPAHHPQPQCPLLGLLQDRADSAALPGVHACGEAKASGGAASD